MPRSKNKRHQQPIPAQRAAAQKSQPASVQVPLGYDPDGLMEARDVIASKDGWSEYTLEDGTTLRIKAALLDVKRAVDQFANDGNPIYVYQCAIVHRVMAPDKLKKQG